VLPSSVADAPEHALDLVRRVMVFEGAIVTLVLLCYCGNAV
jgi:hypothetical protein